MQTQPHLIDPYARHELNLDLSIYDQTLQASKFEGRERMPLHLTGTSNKIYNRNQA